MNIHFYHGRKDISQEMNDWGEDGPWLINVNIGWTYGGIKIYNRDWTDFHFLVLNGGDSLIPIGDMYYGDFEVVGDDEVLIKERKEKINSLSLEKFIILNKNRV